MLARLNAMVAATPYAAADPGAAVAVNAVAGACDLTVTEWLPPAWPATLLPPARVPAAGATLQLTSSDGANTCWVQIVAPAMGGGVTYGAAADTWVGAQVLQPDGMVAIIAALTGHLVPATDWLIIADTSAGIVQVNTAQAANYGGVVPTPETDVEALEREATQRNIAWAEEKNLGLSQEQFRESHQGQLVRGCTCATSQPFPRSHFPWLMLAALRSELLQRHCSTWCSPPAQGEPVVSYITKQRHWHMMRQGLVPCVSDGGDLGTRPLAMRHVRVRTSLTSVPVTQLWLRLWGSRLTPPQPLRRWRRALRWRSLSQPGGASAT